MDWILKGLYHSLSSLKIEINLCEMVSENLSTSLRWSIRINFVNFSLSFYIMWALYKKITTRHLPIDKYFIPNKSLYLYKMYF